MTEKKLCLSRYFSSNVFLVAKMCPKCYSECEDVRIVGINLQFLNKTAEQIPKLQDVKPPEIPDPPKIIKHEPPEDENVKLFPLSPGKEDNSPDSSRSSVRSTWSPPKSPHNLIEESLYRDPWSLLVATIFLNKTSCMIARPFVEKFLEDHPDPRAVLRKSPGDLEPYFSPIGLKKRSEQVWKMSYDYLNKKWKDARQLYGIGKYGEDAYRMFCLGDLDVEPTDRFLKIYKAWYKQEGRKFVEEVSDRYVKRWKRGAAVRGRS